MLQTKQFVLGELDTNSYLAWCDKTFECVIIDPAASGDFITEEILSLQLIPTAIVLTHGHFDHCLGSLELVANFSIPLLIHKNDLALLATAQSSAEHWLKHTVDPVPSATGTIDSSSGISFGLESLTVLETPGHTPGSICLFHPGNRDAEAVHEVYTKEPLLFSGDTLFKGSVGSTNHRYSKPLQLHQSLQILGSLPPQTRVLAGHGEETTLGSENYLWKTSGN